MEKGRCEKENKAEEREGNQGETPKTDAWIQNKEVQRKVRQQAGREKGRGGKSKEGEMGSGKQRKREKIKRKSKIED